MLKWKDTKSKCWLAITRRWRFISSFKQYDNYLITEVLKMKFLNCLNRLVSTTLPHIRRKWSKYDVSKHYLYSHLKGSGTCIVLQNYLNINILLSEYFCVVDLKSKRSQLWNFEAIKNCFALVYWLSHRLKTAMFNGR